MFLNIWMHWNLDRHIQSWKFIYMDSYLTFFVFLIIFEEFFMLLYHLIMLSILLIQLLLFIQVRTCIHLYLVPKPVPLDQKLSFLKKMKLETLIHLQLLLILNYQTQLHWIFSITSLYHFLGSAKKSTRRKDYSGWK